MKEIKKQICKTTYEGNCPVCGKAQTSTWKQSVDVKCGKCRNNEYLEKCKNDLLGAVVTCVTSESCEMTSITLKAQGSTMCIVVDSCIGDDSELVYNIVEDDET